MTQRSYNLHRALAGILRHSQLSCVSPGPRPDPAQPLHGVAVPFVGKAGNDGDERGRPCLLVRQESVMNWPRLSGAIHALVRPALRTGPVRRYSAVSAPAFPLGYAMTARKPSAA